MPSEKIRYRDKNRGPSAPLDWNELKAQMRSFDHDRLLNLLCLRAEMDPVLWKSLSASASMQLAKGNWEKTQEAIDYALYLPDYIRYEDCHYGMIIYEMFNALEILKNQVGKEFAVRTAQYIFNCGQEIIQNFEDDWDWVSSLEDLKTWMENNTP